jgi:hypothetical protein
MNKHKGFILVQAPHGDVIALRPVVFIDALGATKRGAKCSNSLCMKRVWISCHYLKGRCPLIRSPRVP